MNESPFQRRLAIALTLRCNLRCRHCLADSAPDTPPVGDDGRLDLARADLLDWIAQAAGTGKVRVVSFTGGEPFLMYDCLTAGVERTAALGLGATVVTNAYWATSVARAWARLLPLRTLAMLKLSTDVFHEEFVPLERVANAIRAAQELGIPVQVKFCYEADREREVAGLLVRLGGLIGRAAVCAEPIYRVGRAVQAVAAERGVPCEVDRPCSAANVPLVYPDGSVYACCGPVGGPGSLLCLGNLHARPLAALLGASEANVPLHFLRLHGPYQLWQLAAPEWGEGPADLDASSMCSLCLGLTTDPVRRAHIQELTGNPTLIRQTALQRLMWLAEPDMLSGLATMNRPGPP